MTWSSTRDIPDLTGKVAIVTGGNTGLGKECIKQLALHNAKVYLASRTESRARKAIEELTNAHKSLEGRIVFLQLDLTDLKGCQRAAQEFLTKEKRLDILLNNAGIMAVPNELSKDGVEIQFQTNHLGHFAFTIPLLPLLIETSKEKNSSVRLIQVSSSGHSITPWNLSFRSLEDVNNYSSSPWILYGQSKAANILFAKELSRRLKDHKIFSSSVHPGQVNTELTRGPQYFFKEWLLPFWRAFVLLSPEDGALSQLYAATSPDIEENDWRGEYFVPYARRATPTKTVQDEALASQLWELSEKIILEKCGKLV